MKKNIRAEYIFDLMKRKDPKGFECLYEENYRKMYGICFSVLKKHDLCQDAIQNVMFKLYRLKEEQYPKDYHMTWLYRVTKNEALQVLRKDKSSELIDMPEALDLSCEIDKLVDMDQFNHMIDSLNEKQKTVVTLKVLGGFSHKEIAKLLEIPIGTIQWHYNTSIKKLRHLLTGLSSLVLALGISSLYRYSQFLNQENLIPESEIIESIPESGIETVPVPVLDSLTIGLGLSAVILFLVTFLIYKKSEKIPTKYLA